MTSDTRRLLALAQSVTSMDGKRPFKFETRESIVEIAAIAGVLVERGGVVEQHALGIAKTVLHATEGCLSLPLSNVVWWRHTEDGAEKILVVFVERQ